MGPDELPAMGLPVYKQAQSGRAIVRVNTRISVNKTPTPARLLTWLLYADTVEHETTQASYTLLRTLGRVPQKQAWS